MNWNRWKNTVLRSLVFMMISLLPGCGRTSSKNVESRSDGTEIRESVNLYGSFQEIYGCAVIYDPQEQRYSIYHEALAEQEVSPFSTFKIISALSGFENQVVEDGTSTMDYSGEVYSITSWNGNLTLAEAFASSCIWYFRQIVDAVGEEEMQEELDALSYGNCDISQWEGSGVNGQSELNGFWLDSSLKISPLEQVQVLAEIFEGQSGYGQRNVEILKELMLSDDNGIRKVYGKTGSGLEGKAWFVGFVEEENKREYFAVYLDDGYRQDQVSGSKAKEIALDILDNNREFASGEDDRETYRAFVEKNYPSGPTSTLLRELTGDDRQELIVINGRTQEQVSMAVYTIKDDGTVATLYEDTASDSHAGWNWLYLYEEDGKSYLFRYLPIMYQGLGTYSYDIFSLTGEGEEIPLYSGEEDFDMTGGETSEEQRERMGNFLEQVRFYQESAVPLVEIGEDYFETKEGFGKIQKYDYVIDSDELGIRREEQEEEGSDERA